LVRRSVAEALKLPILAKFVNYATAGVPPEIMGNLKKKKLKI
jgi:acetyl-CoA acyltransferase 1